MKFSLVRIGRTPYWLSILSLFALILLACNPSNPTTSSATGVQGTERPPTLRVGLIPNQAPDRVKAQYEPFREYLSRALGQPVETFVATDYAGVVEAMASDRIDIAYFGALTYLQASRRADVYPFVTEIDRETKTTRYYSALIVRAESPYQKPADLAGKRFAFGDISSTSGSLYPRVMLDRAGIGNFTDAQTFVYSGGHDATLAAVINGSVEGGGIEKRIMERAFESGTQDRNKIRIIDQIEVQGYPWVARAKLDPKLVEQITNAFLNLDNAELLRLMRAEKYAKVSKADYEEARQHAERLGLLR